MMILFALLGTALCIGTILFLERNEEGLKLIGSKKDLLVIAGSFFIIEATLFSFTGYGREFICHSLVFFYLITASYIDNRTQQVYRVGSIVFIAFCAALFLCKDMGWEIRFEKTVSLLIFNMAVIAFGKWSSWGGEMCSPLQEYLTGWEHLQMEFWHWRAVCIACCFQVFCLLQ